MVQKQQQQMNEGNFSLILHLLVYYHYLAKYCIHLYIVLFFVLYTAVEVHACICTLYQEFVTVMQCGFSVDYF